MGPVVSATVYEVLCEAAVVDFVDYAANCEDVLLWHCEHIPTGMIKAIKREANRIVEFHARAKRRCRVFSHVRVW